MGYRQVVDGKVQVPLPDDPVARAKAFGEVAVAWSTMLSSIAHLMPDSTKAATLEGGSEYVPQQPWYSVRQPSPPLVESTPAKPNGTHANGKKRGRPLGSKGKKRK